MMESILTMAPPSCYTEGGVSFYLFLLAVFYNLWFWVNLHSPALVKTQTYFPRVIIIFFSVNNYFMAAVLLK